MMKLLLAVVYFILVISPAYSRPGDFPEVLETAARRGVETAMKLADPFQRAGAQAANFGEEVAQTAVNFGTNAAEKISGMMASVLDKGSAGMPGIAANQDSPTMPEMAINQGSASIVPEMARQGVVGSDRQISGTMTSTEGKQDGNSQIVVSETNKTTFVMNAPEGREDMGTIPIIRESEEESKMVVTSGDSNRMMLPTAKQDSMPSASTGLNPMAQGTPEFNPMAQGTPEFNPIVRNPNEFNPMVQNPNGFNPMVQNPNRFNPMAPGVGSPVWQQYPTGFDPISYARSYMNEGQRVVAGY